ncbi:MAG: hypothetical protein K2H46_07360 [Muribaculaceae bacterium]|nr:hypothetical protein [Muribaculaceae bacterium]
MKLVKTNERWDRPFENGQEGSSKLESVQFNVKDDEGNIIGSANVSKWNGNANINFPDGGSARVEVNSYSTIEKGVEILKSVMGISE